MPQLNDRIGAISVEAVLAAFDSREKVFADLCATTNKLVETYLQEKTIKIHSTQSRVKEKSKLEDKYRDSEKDYKSLDDIPDVVGLRIITYYPEEIDQVANVIRQEFELIGSPDDKRIGSPDNKRIVKINEFGYSALHMDCKYTESQLARTEYRRFDGYRFEIQITTILGHAWAEIHHGWYDRKSFSPPDEERRFHRLAAVLELADQEFSLIRKAKIQRESMAPVMEDDSLPDISIP
jgi:ppGpp synthetase/RelA/SpoT-type nucleotidyltranferase